MNDFLGVAVGGDVVKKTVGRREVVLDGCGLVGGESADSGEDREFQRSRVEEQGLNELLDPCLLRGRD